MMACDECNKAADYMIMDGQQSAITKDEEDKYVTNYLHTAETCANFYFMGLGRRLKASGFENDAIIKID